PMAEGGNFLAGTETAGQGVEVAVIDTGIDVTHPCFDDSGYADHEQSGDKNFTNNKVIVAKVFNNKAGSRGYTPEAIQDHGTHVAGTIACNADTPAAVDGVAIPYGVSGVAPAALLGNYNVFPGNVDNARSEDILNALEAAYADGMDVANMSLGGGSHGKQDLLTVAVDNLDMAGMVVAVAAGNSGPGHYTVESPGMAARALAAGASTVGHFVGTKVTVEGYGEFGAASGDFETVDADLTAPLGVVKDGDALSTACSALPDGSLDGEIALISRGACTFSTKIRNAQDAGALAVLVANNVAGDPTAMASDGTPDQPTVPAYMVALSTGTALLNADGASTTIGADQEYITTPNSNIMAGFSSQGPTDVDFRVKPDVVAPGVNVLSSIPMSYCTDEESLGRGCWAFFQGTSMATPHLAGTAAVVIAEHPGWSAAQVRSAIVNTAVRDELTKYTDGMTTVNDVNITGAGLENVPNAVNAAVALDPVSVSFGAVPSGAGQTKTFTVTLTDLTGAGGEYDVSIDGAGGDVTFTLDTDSVDLSSGSATITVTMTASKGADKGDHQAWLNIGGGGSVAHAAVYVFLK
ncbi:MAG TPA: S8 family serine peptidase, partial [Thermomicrobiales bacterium]|nr:S8 family serine peptidase [Thermomicrobiales bacterium]